MKPKVSVIVAAYNIENYIGKCIESLKDQTLKEIEFIIVNDGSRDNTENVIKELILNDSRFTLISQKNGGLSSARNTGLSNTNAPYVAFLDGDDYVEPEMYELLYNNILENSSDLVICGFNKVWYKDEDVTKVKKVLFDEKVIQGNNIIDSFYAKHNEPFVVVWNKLFNRKIIVENYIEFENKAFFEDIGFMIEYLKYVKSINSIKIPLINYIQRDNSITNNKNYNPLIEVSYKAVMRKAERTSVNIKMLNCLNNRLCIYSINYAINRENTKAYKKFKNQLTINDFVKMPTKHIIALMLIYSGLYNLIYRRVK